MKTPYFVQVATNEREQEEKDLRDLLRESDETAREFFEHCDDKKLTRRPIRKPRPHKASEERQA